MCKKFGFCVCQVTSNSSSAKKFPRKPTMSEQQKPDKVDGALAFQTMADALHLQKSVIGKKLLEKNRFFSFSYKQLPF